ncbi:MAG: aminodeoxychorismate lyase, partial [Bryobacteraceae bacterium]
MRLARTIGTLLLLAILAGGFLTFRLIRPYQGFQGETFVDIPRGASTATMAGMLARAGVVRSRWDFLLARLVKRGRVLQAGEYRFDHPASPVEVLGRI